MLGDRSRSPGSREASFSEPLNTQWLDDPAELPTLPACVSLELGSEGTRFGCVPGYVAACDLDQDGALVWVATSKVVEHVPEISWFVSF